MRYQRILVIAAVSAALLVGGWYVVVRVSVSALDDPSRVERYLDCASSLAQSRIQAVVAAEARFIRDDHTHPTGNACPLTAGGCCANCLRMSCAGCHGDDGRVPTAVGRSMYPRAPALDTLEVQRWHLARFVRSVGSQASP